LNGFVFGSALSRNCYFYEPKVAYVGAQTRYTHTIYPSMAGKFIGEMLQGLAASFSYATLKRQLKQLIEKGFISTSGKGKGTRYFVSPA
jgi:hypothetical protein